MFLLGTRPQDQDKLKARPELIYNALEEYKRFDPAVTFIFRVAKADTQIGDQEIKAGDSIFISTHCVNRSNLSDGHEINIERENIQHMAYGHGAHYCIGAKLGRMEMNLLFQSLIKNYPEVRVSSATRDHYSLSFSGFSELMLERV